MNVKPRRCSFIREGVVITFIFHNGLGDCHPTLWNSFRSWGTTPEIYTANLFQSIVQAIEFSGYSMIHVLVTNKEGLTARFRLNANEYRTSFKTVITL